MRLESGASRARFPIATAKTCCWAVIGGWWHGDIVCYWGRRHRRHRAVTMTRGAVVVIRMVVVMVSEECWTVGWKKAFQTPNHMTFFWVWNELRNQFSKLQNFSSLWSPPSWPWTQPVTNSGDNNLQHHPSPPPTPILTMATDHHNRHLNVKPSHHHHHYRDHLDRVTTTAGRLDTRTQVRFFLH